MIGKMYYLDEPEEGLEYKIKWLLQMYCPENVKYVLVHPLETTKEITVKNLKIKPDKCVVMHHFWFISENKGKIYPKFTESEK